MDLIQLDARGRVSLAKFRYSDYDRYIVTKHPDGCSLILTPCRVLPITALGGTQSDI